MIEIPERGSSNSLRLVLIAGAALLAVVLAIVMVVLIRSTKADDADGGPAPAAHRTGLFDVAEEQFARTNAVTLALGGEDSGQGLRLVETQRDGVTAVESRDGVAARVGRLVNDRTALYFYFQIHPAFKAQELRGARFDVEFLDPRPGTMGVHYDAQDSEDVSNPVYREALRPVRLEGSNVWQVASFRTRKDGLFDGLQNGHSDFRLWARTPELYVRRVTVTLENFDEMKWAGDFSTSNRVSIQLGEEQLTDGLRHLADESDGRTRIETRNGAVCRYLNRVADNKPFGFLYFTLAPSFKRDRLKHARVDVEYLALRPGYFRLQFDGMEGDTRRKYQSVLPVDAQSALFGPRAMYARIPTVGTWAAATFHITNAVFQNGQNGDADFRLDVAVPPEIYVRRVTVTREEVPEASAPK